MGLEKDVPPGEKLVACFRPFLEHLASTSLSRKTIRKHVDNLWVLGGEIIRDLHEDPSLRRKDVGKILCDVIDDEGGPLIHGGSPSRYRIPSIPPAESFTGSSANRLAELPKAPTNSSKYAGDKRNRVITTLS